MIKNAIIFVDVDSTVIDHNYQPLPRALEGLWELWNAGCTLYLWSAGGKKYAIRVAKSLDIDYYFAAIIDKPDIIIDDLAFIDKNSGIFFDKRFPNWELIIAEVKDED